MKQDKTIPKPVKNSSQDLKKKSLSKVKFPLLSLLFYAR